MNKKTRMGWVENGFLSALATAGVILASSGDAMAAKFANQFVEFELPAKWQCNLEGAEWVCQSTDALKKRDAIIILAAKLKGDQDSLDQYLAYLKQAKKYSSVEGKPVKSEPKYAKTVQVNEHAWVDSLHLESEIPGFYTRYLATIKKDIGVLVTYSINKDKYKEYLDDFENMVKTLRVFRKDGGLNARPSDSNIFKNTNIPQHLSEGTVFAPQIGGDDAGAGQAQGGGQDDLTLYLILGGAALVAFIVWKRKRG